MYRLQKSNLRKKILTKLKHLNPDEKKRIESSLYASIFQASLWKSANVIGITCSQSFEWNTFPIIEKAWLENKIVTIPKSYPNNKQMKFFQLNDIKELVRGYANILEPNVNNGIMMDSQAIDLLFVPGLLFDCSGYRIGFGGGYYDRFLQQFNNSTVSLVSDFQIMDRIPRDSFDLPVQYLVKKEGWIKTKTVDI